MKVIARDGWFCLVNMLITFKLKTLVSRLTAAFLGGEIILDWFFAASVMPYPGISSFLYWQDMDQSGKEHLCCQGQSIAGYEINSPRVIWSTDVGSLPILLQHYKASHWIGCSWNQCPFQWAHFSILCQGTIERLDGRDQWLCPVHVCFPDEQMGPETLSDLLEVT